MAGIKRKYPKNMSSLNGLEITVEGDEGGLTAKLTGLALAKDENGVDVTEGDFAIADGINFGHLIFEVFTTDVDASSREAIHKTKGELLACKGRAYINNAATNVMVFREKP